MIGPDSQNFSGAEETHPLPPFFPKGAKLLMCGTFPPQRIRWSMDFYYPNFINDMWRVFGIIYFNDPLHLVIPESKSFRLDDIRALLTEKGIALNDTGKTVVRTRDNASDKYLEIIRPLDLDAALLDLPQCSSVATTGMKAAQVMAELTGSKVPELGGYSDCVMRLSDGSARPLRVWRMPSTSRAYPMKLDKKAAYYRVMLADAGCL